MPYASLACDMTSASEVAVAAWGALQVLYAFAFAFALQDLVAQLNSTQLKFNTMLAERSKHKL